MDQVKRGSTGTRGYVSEYRRWELRRARIKKIIKAVIVGGVAWYAMETNQAAQWLTWPAFLWSMFTIVYVIDTWCDGRNY